jgi:hypothetical protein
MLSCASNKLVKGERVAIQINPREMNRLYTECFIFRLLLMSFIVIIDGPLPTENEMCFTAFELADRIRRGKPPSPV